MNGRDCFSSEKRSEVMRAVSHFNTPPEKRLRRSLWHEGFRYRLHRRISNARPDIVFIGKRVAVFVDGCFWHGCPRHYTAPINNAEFWREKLRMNQERDRRNDRELRDEGWTVLRYWSCEIKCDLSRVLEQVRRVLTS